MPKPKAGGFKLRSDNGYNLHFTEPMRQLLDYMAKAEDRYVADIIKRAIKQYAQKWHSHKLYDYENAIKENLTPAQAIARAKADMREISHQLNKAKRLMTIHNIDMDSEE